MVVNHRPGQYARSLHSNRCTPYSLAGNLDELNVLLLVSAMARSDSRSAPCPHAAVPERRRSFAMTLSSSAATSWRSRMNCSRSFGGRLSMR